MSCGICYVEIRRCEPSELEDILKVINDAAEAYRGFIPADCWKDPYMDAAELRRELDEGVVFHGAYDKGRPLAVMGLQRVGDATLIRHAYTRTSHRRRGLGAALLARLEAEAAGPLLVGTWKAAAWAVRFYEKHGFRLVAEEEKVRLLERYWKVPRRQVEESAVLANRFWRASTALLRSCRRPRWIEDLRPAANSRRSS